MELIKQSSGCQEQRIRGSRASRSIQSRVRGVQITSISGVTTGAYALDQMPIELDTLSTACAGKAVKLAQTAYTCLRYPRIHHQFDFEFQDDGLHRKSGLPDFRKVKRDRKSETSDLRASSSAMTARYYSTQTERARASDRASLIHGRGREQRLRVVLGTRIVRAARFREEQINDRIDVAFGQIVGLDRLL